MIDYYSGVDTEYFAGVGDIMVLCHRRLAVVNLFFFFFKSQQPYQVEKKERNGCARGWCVKRGSLLQDCLHVKFQDVKFNKQCFLLLKL